MSDKFPDIIVVTGRFPFPAYGGDTIRILKICENLSRSYKLSLVTFQTKSDSYEQYEDEIKSIFAEVVCVKRTLIEIVLDTLKGWLSGLPIQAAFFYNRRMWKEVAERQHKGSATLCHLIRLYPVVKDFSDNTVLEFTDAISMNHSKMQFEKTQLIKSLVFKYDLPRLIKLEDEAYKRCKASVFVSSKDCNYVARRSNISERNVAVFRNGVDLPLDTKTAAITTTKDIVFVGNNRSLQNYQGINWFLDNVYPRLQDLVNEPLGVKVVGYTPEKLVKKWVGEENLVFTQTVPNIQNEIRGAQVAIAPLFLGAGIQNKLLEYAAARIPLVTTSLAASGHGFKHNVNCKVADTVDDFTSSIIDILTRPEDANVIVENAYDLVKSSSWEKCLEGYQACFI